MADLLVYSDWHGERGPRLLGVLSAEQVRGRETFSFAFDESRVRDGGDISLLDPDLSLCAGRQFPPRGKASFLGRLRRGGRRGALAFDAARSGFVAWRRTAEGERPCPGRIALDRQIPREGRRFRRWGMGGRGRRPWAPVRPPHGRKPDGAPLAQRHDLSFTALRPRRRTSRPLRIDRDDPTADFSVALRAARDFRISPVEADATLRRIRDTVSGWRTVAKSFGLPAGQVERMRTAFAAAM